MHLTGGIGALVGAIVTGPRVGRFEPEGMDPNGTYAPHNVPNAALGTFILWFGWCAFDFECLDFERQKTSGTIQL